MYVNDKYLLITIIISYFKTNWLRSCCSYCGGVCFLCNSEITETQKIKSPTIFIRRYEGLILFHGKLYDVMKAIHREVLRKTTIKVKTVLDRVWLAGRQGMKYQN